MNNNVCIYALVDPRTGEIRYVGQSIDPFRRLEDHLGKPKTNKAKRRWLDNLYKSHHLPVMMVLDWVSEEQANEYEHAWVNVLVSDGVTLTNSDLNPNGLRQVKKAARPKQTDRIFQYMDQIYETEGRVAPFSEVSEVLGTAKATTSDARRKWLEERGVTEE